MLRLAIARLAPASRLTAHSQVRNSLPRTFTTTMAQYHPNTDPPKGFAIFKNIEELASGSDKFRRVLWTGTHSQVRSWPA